MPVKIRMQYEVPMNQENLPEFYFASVDRPEVIEPHHFYVKEARKRIFSQFSDIIAEAGMWEQQYLEMAAQNFDPEWDDPTDVYDQAYQERCSHGVALNEMKNAVTLALTAGMFHQFDKTLREKVVTEFRHWRDHNVMQSLIWDAGFPRLIDLLEWCGLNIKKKDFYNNINACRLVVNVYKHGDGDAHRELSAKYPQYYQRPGHESGHNYARRHEELEVSETQFTEFADAITAFWDNIIPIHSSPSGTDTLPEWFETEYRKHEKRVRKHLTSHS